MTPIRLIRLPWPPKEASPNGSHGSWHKKAKAVKKYKDACIDACKAQAVQPMACNKVDAEITFNPPSLHRYDLDNALAKAKQGLDAVADAIGVDDARWRSVRLVRGEKVKGGALLVQVSPVEAGQ